MGLSIQRGSLALLHFFRLSNAHPHFLSHIRIRTSSLAWFWCIQASVNSSDLENVVILSFAPSHEVEAALETGRFDSAQGFHTNASQDLSGYSGGFGGGGGGRGGSKDGRGVGGERERHLVRRHVLAASEAEAEKFRCALMSVVTRLVGPVKSMHVPDQVVCSPSSPLSLSLSREQVAMPHFVVFTVLVVPTGAD